MEVDDTLEREVVRAQIRRSLFGKEEAPPKIHRFAVLDTLGRGGMGIVHRAYDPQLRREVALKLILGQGNDEQGRERLLREAQAMARLSHPNVLPVFEAGEYEGRVFMVMELVEGGTLGDWLEVEPRPQWRAIVETFVQAARGLHHAHAAGIVHRDFKPQNVLMGEDGRPRVMDFGLARPPERARSTTLPDGSTADLDTPLTRTGSVLGTPAYMSPEQHDGRVADARSDQFSVCVALWEALYERRPFAGDDYASLAKAVREGRLEEPKRSEVPESIARILRRGLAVDAEDRYASVGELAGALAQAAEPRRRMSGGWWVGAGAIGLAAVAALAIPANEEGENLCPEVPDVFETPALEQIDRMTGAGPAWATASWHSIGRQLQGFSDDWRERYDAACEAAQTSRGPDRTLPMLKLECLMELASEVEMQRSGMVLAGREGMLSLASAYRGQSLVPDAMRCDNVTWLRRRPPLPRDPAKRKEFTRLQSQLFIAQSSRKDAWLRPHLEQLIEDGEALGYGPFIATARLRYTQQRKESGADESELAVLREELLAAADSSGSDEASFEAWRWEGFHVLPDLDAARRARARAHAAWKRGGEFLIPGDRGLWDLDARIAMLAGEHDEALAIQQRAVVENEKRFGPEAAQLIPQLMSTADTAAQAGRLDVARSIIDRALRLHEQETERDHPGAAAILWRVATVAERQGRFSDAREALERAVTATKKPSPDGPELVAAYLDRLGHLEYDHGDPTSAVARWREAERLLVGAQGPTDPPVLTGSVATLAWWAVIEGEPDARTRVDAQLSRDDPARKEDLMPEVMDALLAARAGDRAKAEHQLQTAAAGVEALRIDDPEQRAWVDAWLEVWRGMVARALEDRVGARAAFDRALELDAAHPDSRQPWQRAELTAMGGIVRMEAGDPDAACPVLREAASLLEGLAVLGEANYYFVPAMRRAAARCAD